MNNLEAERLVARITEDLRRLRYIIEEPVGIKYGYDVPVDIEVRPFDDDRVLVGCEGRGFTTVNYTDEDLMIDVIPRGPSTVCTGPSLIKKISLRSNNHDTK